MNENFDIFDNFVMKYDLNEKMIEYKYNHSYRVVHQSEEIARFLKLDEENKELASLIALLHDLGRFNQWRDYKNFMDHESIDHAEEAIRILFEENEIEKYQIDKKYYDILKTSILNHNKLNYDEEKLSKEEILHTKIIRDADKIDILYSFSTNRLLEIEEDDSPISQKVHESFMKHEVINKKDIENKNDKTLMLIALIYDLNYEYSKRRIYEEGYINRIYEHLKNKKIFKPYIEEINNYLKEEMKKC